MSGLEELIAELCPDGVEFKRLGECCSLEKGSTPIHKGVPGEYPLVVTTEERKSSNTYQFDAPTVCIPLVSSRGHGIASLNQVYYQEGKFALGNILCGVTPTDGKELSASFLYHYLNYKKDTILVPLMKGGANVSLTVDSLRHVKVPIPPIEMQIKIISILDSFVALSAELKAELTARKKQYEYYRDKLLTFGVLGGGTSECVWSALRSVVKASCSGGTPTKNNYDYYEDGNIPWIRTQDVHFNEIYEVDTFITETAVRETSVKWIPENCVIVAISGASAGRCAINKIRATTNQHCLNMEIDPSQALYKYIYYCVCSKYQELIAKKQGARGDLNSSLILETEIPVPPLPIQKNIVAILDRFDALCNDLTSGLPAEVAARQKQYEYYRDKLLTFKEKKCDY